MVMTLHKLTAGEGYLYLVRQVAAADSTHRGRSTLADYYSAKGESPGRWIGRGLTALSQPPPNQLGCEPHQILSAVEESSEVQEAQMRALYGEGLHPNADRIMSAVAGQGIKAQSSAAQIGRRFLVRNGEPEFARRVWPLPTASTTPRQASIGAPPSPPTTAQQSAPAWHSLAIRSRSARAGRCRCPSTSSQRSGPSSFAKPRNGSQSDRSIPTPDSLLSMQTALPSGPRHTRPYSLSERKTLACRLFGYTMCGIPPPPCCSMAAPHRRRRLSGSAMIRQ